MALADFWYRLSPLILVPSLYVVPADLQSGHRKEYSAWEGFRKVVYIVAVEHN
jgi:hypothetical protein